MKKSFKIYVLSGKSKNKLSKNKIKKLLSLRKLFSIKNR